jgi:hypothetical protein
MTCDVYSELVYYDVFLLTVLNLVYYPHMHFTTSSCVYDTYKIKNIKLK